MKQELKHKTCKDRNQQLERQLSSIKLELTDLNYNVWGTKQETLYIDTCMLALRWTENIMRPQSSITLHEFRQ